MSSSESEGIRNENYSPDDEDNDEEESDSGISSLEDDDMMAKENGRLN